MTVKLTISQFQKQLPEVLDRAVETGDEYVVQRNGKDHVVIVSAQRWKRLATGKRLDALGRAYRLPKEKQKRTNALLARSKQGILTQSERRELNSLLRESEAVMLRRAQALDQLL